MSIDELIAKLETAAEGSPELDEAIAALVGRRRIPVHSPPMFTNCVIEDVPRWTTRIDEALTLVPEGMGYIIIQSWRRCGGTNATVTYEGPDGTGHADKRNGECTHGSTPLALCVAALKARRASAQEPAQGSADS